MEFLGVGAMEALLVLVVALIVVGPRRFPEIARQGGRWYGVARRYANEVSKDVRGAMDELKTEIEEEGADLRAIRDLGEAMDADLRATKLDVEEVGADAARAADAAGSTSDGAAPRNAPSAPTAGTSGDAGDSSDTPSAKTNDGEPTR
jgi:sec-independent protein translocase protein TatB